MTESTVFLHLIENGEQTAVQISNKTKIPKTTVYHILEDLIDRKFVEPLLGSRGKKYKAQEGNFESVAKKKLKSAKDLTHMASLLQKNLPTLSSSSLQKTSFRVYEGINGLKQLMWNVLSAKDMIYYYSSADRRKLFGDVWFERFCREFVKRNLWERGFDSMVNAGYAPELDNYYFKTGYHKRTEYKIIKGLDMTSEIFIYNNVYNMYSWEKNELIGIEIENKFLVESQRKIFEKLWNETEAVPGLSFVLDPHPAI